MDFPKNESTVDECENVQSATHVKGEGVELKISQKGIVLVPQPSDDKRDPLNWPMWKKCLNLAIVTLASFAGAGAGLSNTGSFVIQAELYHVTPIDMSYGTSATVAGLGVGPFIWAPQARQFGRSTLVFWGMLLTMGTSIWGGYCTGEGDYISFVMSRLLAGLFGSCATTVGAGLIVEVFYLHQRGKAFSVYSIMLLVGTIATPTFSGFIVSFVSWPVQFWYNAALEGFTALVAFLFLEETGWTRPNGPVYPKVPQKWWPNRLATFFATKAVVPRQTFSGLCSYAAMQFVIGVSPVALLSGFYLFVTFGWAVGVNNLLAVFLLEPPEAGGYGFTPFGVSCFYFTSWIAITAAQFYGYFLTDRIPLAACKRFGGGIWRPEYRLHSLWIPGLIVQPIGLGIFGACLRYHLHPALLAFGDFLIVFGSLMIVPIIDNYAAECFTTRATEACTCMNMYRTAFGVAVPFFIEPWIEAVGVNWVFGMMGFFSVFMYLIILLLLTKGHTIRQATLARLSADEEGVQLRGTEGIRGA